MSNNVHQKSFVFSDGETHDASVSEASQAIKITYKNFWSLIPVIAGLDASPTYSIEVSNDNVNFAPYNALTTNAAIDQPFDDVHFNFLYMRVNYAAAGTTTGTVAFPLLLKNHA